MTTLEDKDEGYCGANCSLREAIYAANDAVGPATIKFSISGTIMLNSLPPYITNKAGVTIDGNGQKVIIQGYKPDQFTQRFFACGVHIERLGG